MPSTAAAIWRTSASDVFGGAGGMPGAPKPGGSVAGRDGKAAGKKMKADAKDAPAEPAEKRLDELKKSTEEVEKLYEDARSFGVAVRQLYRKVDPTREWA